MSNTSDAKRKPPPRRSRHQGVAKSVDSFKGSASGTSDVDASGPSSDAASKLARLEKLKRQSIFAPGPDDKVPMDNLNPAFISTGGSGAGKKNASGSGKRKVGISLDVADSTAIASRGKEKTGNAVEVKAQQSLSRRSSQSHSLRYGIFAHNMAVISAIYLIIMGPVAIMWGQTCLDATLEPGTLGVLVVEGTPRVRVNSKESQIVAGVAGVSEKYFVATASACQGQIDYIVGWVAIGVGFTVLLVIEPFCGNRRDVQRCAKLCDRNGEPVTLPWRAILYLLLSAATLGSLPTTIGGIGFFASSVSHLVAALKGEHGNAHHHQRKQEFLAKRCGYYLPSICRLGFGSGKHLWDHHHEESGGRATGCMRKVQDWWEVETREQSNFGKFFILAIYIFMNLYLFFERFDLMISSGALVNDDVLEKIATSKITELSTCDPESNGNSGVSIFACPASGVFPPPKAIVRAFCENALSEEAGDSFESISIGAFSGNNVMPPRSETELLNEPAQSGIMWIVVHSATTVSFRIELSSLSGAPTDVHMHGPANPFGAAAGLGPATAGVLYSIYGDDNTKLCPNVGALGEELICEAKQLDIGEAAVSALRQGRVYVNVHTSKHPDGEVRANLRETFVGMLKYPEVPDAAEGTKTVPPAIEDVPKDWAQGLSTVYLLDDGSTSAPPAIDFVISIGNLESSISTINTGKVTDIDLIRKVSVDISTEAGASSVSSSGTSVDSNDPSAALAAERLQSLCSDNAGLVGRRTCTKVVQNSFSPGCNSRPGFRGSDGSAESTVKRGKCGPFLPNPILGSRTPTSRGLRSNHGNVMQLLTYTQNSISANETVSALRARRISVRASNTIGGLLLVGDLFPAVAIAYSLPPLADKRAKFAGAFTPTPFSSTIDTKGDSNSGFGSVSLRILTPRSFSYVVELHSLSGVPTNGIFIRGPGLRATQSLQLNLHTIAEPVSRNRTQSTEFVFQNCDVTTASFTFCAGTAVNLDEAVVYALIQGQLFVEARTSRNPYGEVRAMIQPVLSEDDLDSFTSSSIASLVDDISIGTDESREATIARAAALLACDQPLARNLHLSLGGAWAKSFGQVLNFNCALVLFPILRYMLRVCNNYGSRTGTTRRNGLSAWIPFERNIDFHKLIALVICVCTVGHVLAHFINYTKAPDATVARFHWFAWFSGFIITISMFFIFSGGQPNVKRAHYELFINSHRGFAVLFFIMLFFHGPVFWKWGIMSFILYLTEVVLRQYRGSKHFFVRSVRYVPPVMELKFKPRHADEFRFLEGQYLYLNCPYISNSEWHPFTISSAIGDLDQGGDEGWVSVHVRIIPGGWTEKLLRYFCAMEGRDLNNDDLKHELSLNLFRRDAKGERQIGKDRGVDGKPLLLVDGPHSAPAQHYTMFDHVMMIGAGIGLTPSCSVLRSVLKYKWKKGWKPNVLKFYWVVRHSEISSFIWFLEQLVHLERELIADKLTGTTKIYNSFEANIYITRAPAPGSPEVKPSEDTEFLLSSSMYHMKRSNSVTRGLAPSPLAKPITHDHTVIEPALGGRKASDRGMGNKKRSSVSVAGVASMTDIGYDIRDLYHCMLNPSVQAKQQTVQQTRENADMADNRLGSVWIWNGRPDWDQIFDQNATTKYEKVGVAFCGTPFIGKDLAKFCKQKSSRERGLYFTLLKENF